NATPPTLQADGIDAIDDVAFVDHRHGWVAAYSCGAATVYLYHTATAAVPGGRSASRRRIAAAVGRPSSASSTTGTAGWSRSARMLRRAFCSGRAMEGGPGRSWCLARR